MKNTLINFDYMDLSHGEIIAIMRFALTAQWPTVTVDATFFDEIITRMTSLKGELDDANDKIDRLEREKSLLGVPAKDIDDANDHVATLNEKEQAKEMELNRFLRQLERDAEDIGGDTGARINEAVGLIEAIRQDPYGGSDSLAIANEERLENKWNSSPF